MLHFSEIKMGESGSEINHIFDIQASKNVTGRLE
jgi:hypothetical protein